MKMLFICYANVGRSQVAEAFFKNRSRHDCASAGIAVDEKVAQMKAPSKKLKDDVIQRSVEFIRRQVGIDVGEKERQQLLPEMIDAADLAIVMAAKAQWPGYLIEGGKVVFWDIPDPGGLAEGPAHDVYGEVGRRVDQLVAEIG